MGRISLQGMKFKSHIGVYTFEQQYGNNFEVDVIVQSDKISGMTDELANTIDYDKIYTVVKNVMNNRYHLIEHAGQELLELIRGQFDIDYLFVKITKLHPPLGGEVDKVSAELEWFKGKI